MGMTANQSIWAFTLALTSLAGGWDWSTRRIPNWLTVPAFFTGIFVRTWISGWHGLAASLEGAGLALVLLLPLVLMRGLGAGDWKLMGAVGAFLGPMMTIIVLLSSILISGLMAMVSMLRANQVVSTLRNMVVLLRGFLAFGFRKHPEISLDNPGLLKLPFGVAVAIGTLGCFLAALWVS
jgi:prepilin peptidase CpaA